MATTFKIKNWKTDFDASGKAAVTKQGGMNVYDFDSKGVFKFIFKYATLGLEIGIVSGRALEMTNGISYYLVTLRTPVSGKKFVYVSRQDFSFLTPKVANEPQAKEDAQSLLNGLIKSDKDILTKINTFNALLSEAEKRGVDVAVQRAELKKIADAWVKRQVAIKTNPLIRITQTFNLSGIGIAPILIGIAVGAGIVIAGFTVYYFLKPEYNTSQLHSKYITENENILRQRLGDEEFNKLKTSVDTEIKSNASTAYSAGKSEGYMNIIKPIGFGLLGFFLVSKLQSAKR